MLLHRDHPSVLSHFGSSIRACEAHNLLESTQQCGLVLLSGSATFIRSQETYISASIPAIGILEKSQRSSLRLLSDHWKTWNYQHSQLGGVTAA